jgi:hypothetical protein
MVFVMPLVRHGRKEIRKPGRQFSAAAGPKVKKNRQTHSLSPLWQIISEWKDGVTPSQNLACKHNRYQKIILADTIYSSLKRMVIVNFSSPILPSRR